MVTTSPQMSAGTHANPSNTNGTIFARRARPMP
jgi:hypothetical protein